MLIDNSTEAKILHHVLCFSQLGAVDMVMPGCEYLCSCPEPESPDCKKIECGANASPVCDGDELCRCDPPYIGDGYDCVKDCIFNGETIPVSYGSTC